MNQLKVRTAHVWTTTQQVFVILPTFRDNLSDRFLTREDGTDRFRNVGEYHYSLRNSPEERSSRMLRGGSLKSPK